jgi:general secretion pathway protein C
LWDGTAFMAWPRGEIHGMFDQFLEHYRRYYWLANGALLIAIAYVAAGFIVREAIERFVPVPEAKPRVVQTAKAERKANINDYQIILERNLLNIKVENVAPVAVAGPFEGEPVKATIQATLLGTVAGPAKHSFSIVSAGGKVEVVRIGELIAGQAEILEINRGSVTILNNGRQEILTLYDEKEIPGKPARPVRRHLPEPVELRQDGGATPDFDANEIAPGQYEIDKAQFEEMTSNLGPLLTQARVVPNFKEGNIDGYKVFAIKPDSVYQSIGLNNGDVIHSINGVRIDSPEKALQLFQSLRTERAFTIDLSRNDTPMTFNYNLR